MADPDELAPDGMGDAPDPLVVEPLETAASRTTVPMASAAIRPTTSAIRVASLSRFGTLGGGIGRPAAS
jgi:hypothetical protein